MLRIFDESSATELTIEEEGIRLHIVKQRKNAQVEASGSPPLVLPVPLPSYTPAIAPQPSLASPPGPAPVVAEQGPSISAPPEVKAEKKLHEIRSPIVGTFYRAPAPDAEPFVHVGSRVTPGTTLCIIEAMKLMNEIQSDVAGTVAKILVENAQPVEYNQLLFLIEPD
ncbi:MAG: acetyl-CoA carboxylase biotin carboxyl carrier protein [Candidatus Kapabacteria bacterium]|nr:acetyl-CoA carboxylase biotin carboxyl carrier protein [Candidatus Kapabacteria bacterium]MDW8225120.1 acetyl-CoA carboxylase biotin carboxyl carrier protein [Bacteroidota bacterium]